MTASKNGKVDRFQFTIGILLCLSAIAWAITNRIAKLVLQINDVIDLTDLAPVVILLLGLLVSASSLSDNQVEKDNYLDKMPF